MAFRDILGQEHALALLQKALGSTRRGHAYLLYGPNGVGKRLTALQFAKALACRAAASGAIALTSGGRAHRAIAMATTR